MSYFRYIDNGEGPTKLFIGGVHGNEGVTSLKFLKASALMIYLADSSISYNFDRHRYISTIKKEYYESELGLRILDLIDRTSTFSYHPFHPLSE